MTEGTEGTLLDQFDSALRLVTLDRRDIYGQPSDTYRRIAAIRTIVDECPDPQVREILGMIATKLVRLIQSPDHLDYWIDVGGYARCGVMLLDERQSDRPREMETAPRSKLTWRSASLPCRRTGCPHCVRSLRSGSPDQSGLAALPARMRAPDGSHFDVSSRNALEQRPALSVLTRACANPRFRSAAYSVITTV